MKVVLQSVSGATMPMETHGVSPEEMACRVAWKSGQMVRVAWVNGNRGGKDDVAMGCFCG